MSYKNVVLNDYPSSFYMLDEVVSSSIPDYDQLKIIYPTYQDLKDSGVSYAYLNGSPIIDYSGNNNSGVAVGATTSKLMPLVPGSIRGTEIDYNSKITYFTDGFGNSSYSDNAFSIEFWFRPPNKINAEIILVADNSNNIGVFYNDENLYFRALGNECFTKIEKHKSYHVVAIYNKSTLSLYLDGILLSSINIKNIIPFPYSESNFQTGPSTEQESFIIDCVAFYRYALSEYQIKNHYRIGNYDLDYGQIVYPDKGILFSLNGSRLNVIKKYFYPKTKKWSELLSGDAIISADQSYITFSETETSNAASFSFVQELFIPEDVAGSFLYFEPNISNISVEVSKNGLDNWIQCNNYSSIPFFNKETYDGTSRLFIKTTMISNDTSIDLPKLKSVGINFYGNVDLYADNSGDILTSEYDYNMSQFNERVLSQNKYNGLRMNNGGGFDITLSSEVRTLELIYTPGKLNNILFSINSKAFLWDEFGDITSNGVSKIYVNGVDITGNSNLSEYLIPGYPHHIVCVLASNETSPIKFNSNGILSGSDTLFSNIAIYDYALPETQILEHYQMYIGSNIKIVNQDSMSLNEMSTGNDNSPYSLYDIDWQRSSSV